MTFFEIQNQQLRLCQPLTLEQVPRIWRALLSADLTAVQQLDLSQVDKLDSSGIAFIIELQRKIGQPITLFNGPSYLSTLLSLYNLESQIQFESGV